VEDRSVDGRIILRWNLRKWDVGQGLNRVVSGEGLATGTCECSIEPTGCIKCGEFLD